MSAIHPGGYNGYYLDNTGVYLPLRTYKESKSVGQQVTDQGYAKPQTLEQYIRWQLQQTRRKYFVFHEMYRRDTWIRASVDYIVRRSTRDDNRLIDEADPLNPDIVDLKEFMDYCYPDGDFTDLYRGVVQDMLEYGQSYMYIERTKGGKPVHLYPIESRITFPVTDFHGTILFHAQVYNGAVEVLENEDIIYFSWSNNGVDPKPLPPMETLIESVAMELNANKYNAMLFENNLNIGAIFSVPNATDEDIEDNLRYLKDHYATPENAHRPLMLKGDAKLLRDGALAVKDINFELLIKLARHRVSAVFGVPESLLGIPDNTNRATGNVHERNTYVNTVRPLRRYVNKRFTQKFIREVWGSKSVKLEEPINSMLPTKEELEAVDTAASVGLMYNDILEMMGLPRVPNGDYFVMKGPNGTYQRLDLIAMPGLGDKHFDFDAYQLEHQATQEAQSQQAMEAGMSGVEMPQPQGGAETPYVPPRSQDQIQLEPIAARIVDVSRSLVENNYEWDLEEAILGDGLMEIWTGDLVVSRRIPMAPGSRGSPNVYTTSGGKIRYGKPTGAQRKPGPEAPNTLTNPRDPNTNPRLNPQEKLQMAHARSQVETLFRLAQQENWSNEQFMDKLETEGWEKASGTRDVFHDVRDARDEARRLGENYPDQAYTLLGADGAYFIMQKPLAEFEAKVSAPKSQDRKAGEKFDTGNIGKDPQTSGYRETRDKQTTGSPNKREGAKPRNETNEVGRSEWYNRAKQYARGSIT